MPELTEQYLLDRYDFEKGDFVLPAKPTSTPPPPKLSLPGPLPLQGMFAMPFLSCPRSRSGGEAVSDRPALRIQR
ncbi:MAG: hypothetical protein HY900_08165 [Deltaproteobacteria bacterium]|nr:hypothetical protein [Deltaproteobacteria bacterium]